MGRPYPFRNPFLRWGMGLVDAVGGRLADAGLFGAWKDLPEGAQVRRIVFLRLDHIGDGLFTLPALRAARRVFPKAHLTLLGAPWADELVQPLRLVDEVRVFRAPWFERGGSGASWAQGVARLRALLEAGRYDVAVDFRGDARHLWAMYRAGIPTRVGYGQTGFGFLLNAEPLGDPLRHEAESCLELLRLWEPSLSGYSLPSLTAGPDAMDRLETLFRLQGWGWETRPLVVQFAAGYPSKDWGDDRFAEALARLTSRGYKVALIGGEKDRLRGEVLASRVGKRAVCWCGKTRLSDLVALLSKALLYIGLDSGPSHLAVAMKTPSVLLYGDINDLRRWGPWTRGREDRVRVLHGTAPCGPCGKAECPVEGHPCLRTLPVGLVVRSAREMLSRRRVAKA